MQENIDNATENSHKKNETRHEYMLVQERELEASHKKKGKKSRSPDQRTTIFLDCPSHQCLFFTPVFKSGHRFFTRPL